MKFFIAFLIFSLGIADCTTAFAEEAIADASSLDDDVIPIYGNACEKIKGDEAKSTARVRVTDKASFLAVSSVLSVMEYKNELNEHDFNVMVYSLVDNSVEDMAVRTTKQDNENICVEVTGYINKDSIVSAFDNAAVKEPADKTAKESMTEIVNEVNKSYSDSEIDGKHKPGVIPPTDEATLEKYKAPVQETAPQPKQIAIAADDKRGLVYVAPTEFFNNTQSEKHAKILKQLFSKNDYFYITNQKDLADYIVKSKVLRAKVDPINSSTNRLQMVISVEVEFVENKTSATEHQNRFVLFSSEESEQEAAFKLMKKLFEKAGETIKRKIEQAERKKGNGGGMLPQIITPANSRQTENTPLSI